MILLNWLRPKKQLCEIEFTYTVAPRYETKYTFECLAYCPENVETTDLVKLFRPFSFKVKDCRITNIVAEKIPTV